MRYPLLLEANPTTTQRGPSVWLPAGEWVIEHTGLSSKFEIVFDNSFPEETASPKAVIDGDRILYVRITDPGSDKTLTVYAKCQSR